MAADTGLNSSDTSSGADALAVQYNNLRADVKLQRQMTMTYGETIDGNPVPAPVYLDSGSGKVLLCDGNVTTKTGFIGFAIEDGVNNDTKAVQIAGICGGFSGLTAGLPYYLSDTVGTITATPGTYPILVGYAVSTTQIFITSGMNQNPIGGSSSVSVSGSGTSFSTDDSTVLTLVLYRPSRVVLHFAGIETSRSGNAQTQSFTAAFNVDAGTTIITGYSTSEASTANYQNAMNASCSVVTAVLGIGSHTFKMRVSGSSVSSMGRGLSGTLYGYTID